MQDFDERYTYFIKDLVIEKLPASLNRVIEIESDVYNFSSPPPFADFVRDSEKDFNFSVTRHTIPVIRLWKGFIDNNGDKQHIRASFAFCRKFEKILGTPINTILKERDDAKSEARNLLDRNINLKCSYRSLEYKSILVETTLQDMTLFDRLMFVIDGYEYLELLFNLRKIKKREIYSLKRLFSN